MSRRSAKQTRWATAVFIAFGVMAFFLWPQISTKDLATKPVILDPVPKPALAVVGAPSSVAPSPSPSISRSPISLDSAEAKQISVFDEILQSKNDNDQRLDTDLRHLSAKVKRTLEQKYQNMPTESRNSRGTVALLIGRDLNSPEDVEFLKTILNEPPCLSLENCGSAPAGDDEHGRGPMGVTLVYPQLVTLTMLDRYLASPEASPELKRMAKEAIESARQNANSQIVSKANQILGQNP